MDGTPPDAIRERLLECAGACLDHIRVVKWGDATAAYTVTTTEGDRVLDILVRVICSRKAVKDG